jgi:hypothetical protein
MKRSIIFLFVFSLILSVPVSSQGLLKKVTGAMKDELLGKSGKSSASQDPEPPCACSDAELVVGLGGKYNLNYKELYISIADDGSVLMQDRQSGNYYVAKDGVTTGPYQAGDPRISGYENYDPSDNSMETLLKKYKGYISKSGDKYLITFGGKTYGPYAQINNFAVTKSKDKFAALVTENIVMTESEGKKMDAAVANAKTDQEKMELAMKYAQQMQQKMMQGGGPTSITPKLVTNYTDPTFNPMLGGTINGNMKYDDILVSSYDKVLDLQGKTVIALKQDHIGAQELFVSSDNSRYAFVQYGSLVFSNNNTPITDLINPHLIKVNGIVYIAYMYYSPKKNSLMQCKIAF